MGNPLNKFKILLKNNPVVRGAYFLWRSYFYNHRKHLGYCGDGVIITPPLYVANHRNVHLYDKTNLASNSWISAVNAKFIVHKNCAIAEGLTVHTGNHVRTVGKFITDITEETKPSGYDHDVIIESDVWIGCNVTLLSGVTVGRGATIAAGSIVVKSIPPYCVAGGVPCKPLKFYWTIDQILEHESKIYAEKDRYTREFLEKLMN